MKKIIIGLALAAFAFMAQSQALTVATGDAKAGSTYSRMFRELSQACPNVMQEKETNGGATNMALVTGNQVAMAIVPTDMLFFTKSVDAAKVENIRTLVTLHPEELHFVARADVKKEGGFMGFNAKSKTYNAVVDLKDRPVGAVGGSVLSGRVFSQYSKLNLQIVEFPNNDALKAALLEGKVDSILVVGGAPHGLVASLDQRFRILEVSEDIRKSVAAVYKPAKLSYSNLNQAGVNSVSTQAQLVTRVWRGEDMQNKLKALRACFTKSVPNIQDTVGSHAKWQDVKPTDKGNWTYYELN